MTASPPAPRARLASVDLVRGAIMIAMALDHVRDFLGAPSSPTNLATTTPALFATRWITHFCAPVFCLLTGVGARLSLGTKPRGALARFHAAWLGIVVASYPLCRWYAAVKQRHRHGWLSYL